MTANLLAQDIAGTVFQASTGASPFGSVVVSQAYSYGTFNDRIVISDVNAAQASLGIEAASKISVKTATNISQVQTTRTATQLSNTIAAGPTTASYEDMTLYVMNETSDVSTSLVLKDCVAIDTRGLIKTGNTNGRAWGLYASATAPAASQGQLIAAEMNVYNNTGVNAATPLATTQKNGVFVNSIGNANNTAAVYVVATSPSLWTFGLYGAATSIASNFIRYDDFDNGNVWFRIAQDGQIVTRVGDSMKNATDNASAALAGVPLNGIYYDSTANNVLKVRTA